MAELRCSRYFQDIPKASRACNLVLYGLRTPFCEDYERCSALYVYFTKTNHVPSSCRTPIVLAHRRAQKLILCLAASQRCGPNNRISVHQVRISSLNFSGETIDYIGLPSGTCMYQTASRFTSRLFIVIFGRSGLDHCFVVSLFHGPHLIGWIRKLFLASLNIPSTEPQ